MVGGLVLMMESLIRDGFLAYEPLRDDSTDWISSIYHEDATKVAHGLIG